MKKELMWNVYMYDFNDKKFKSYNIFKHYGFLEYLYKAKVKYLKKDCFNFDDFMEQVKKELQYYFWSKCEYEIILKSWPKSDVEEKIDIYDQVINNWEAFKEYLFNNYKLIKKVK